MGYKEIPIYKDIVKKKQAPPTNMPASFSPAPNSMASLSIEEGAGSTLDTATTTVPVVIPVEKEKEDLVGASSSLGGSEGEKDGEKDGKKKRNRCLSCKKKLGLTGKPEKIFKTRFNIPLFRVHLSVWRPVLLHTQIQRQA